jgi:hypothetical protein
VFGLLFGLVGIVAALSDPAAPADPDPGADVGAWRRRRVDARMSAGTSSG